MFAHRTVHRSAAAITAAFAMLHMANHTAALGGIDAHLAFMEQARAVYRQPLIETVLLLAVALQAASGVALLRARPGAHGWFARVQALSGAYLALFFLIHVSAVLAGRALFGLDTNVHFGAAGLQPGGYPLFFVPYYFLAILALFVHVGCALARLTRSHPRLRAGIVAGAGVVGAMLAVSILAALMGQLYPYQVPPDYRLSGSLSDQAALPLQ
ncbi:MAG: hypothetical protein ACLGI6_01185 [Gammaproteobacteria bacterium]